jgi:hypothetical protein
MFGNLKQAEVYNPADDIAKSKKQAESTAGCKLTSQAKKA